MVLKPSQIMGGKLPFPPLVSVPDLWTMNSIIHIMLSHRTGKKKKHFGNSFFHIRTPHHRCMVRAAISPVVNFLKEIPGRMERWNAYHGGHMFQWNMERNLLKAGCVKSSNDIRIKSNSNKGYRIQKTLRQSGHTRYSAYVFTKQKTMQHNNWYPVHASLDW